MKKIVLWIGLAALGLCGCASDDHHYAHHRYYDDHNTVVLDRDGNRTYVRERDDYWRDRDRDDHWRHEYRGKHPDALGWNDPYWYHY